MAARALLSILEYFDQRGLFWKCGLVGIGVITFGILVNTLFYRGRLGEIYNPLNHFVSELGEIGVAPMAEIFNFSLIIGGLCMALSVLGLALRVSGWWGGFLTLVGLFCGISGSLVGVSQ